MKATPEDVAKQVATRKRWSGSSRLNEGHARRRGEVRRHARSRRPLGASMKATPEDVAKLPCSLRSLQLVWPASMKATPEDVAKLVNEIVTFSVSNAPQ